LALRPLSPLGFRAFYDNDRSEPTRVDSPRCR
jgi:hypothetical protein